MSNNNNGVNPINDGTPSFEGATVMPGLTATMEIAGAESIPGANPDPIILGFSREEE